MKKSIIITIVAIFTMSCDGNSQTNKPYPVKSGMVEYVITSHGKMLGTTIDSKGTESLYFKDWGNIVMKKDRSTETSVSKFFGRETKEEKETQSMTKMVNELVYIVDFESKTISEMENTGMMAMNSIAPNTEAHEFGKSSLEALGGEKIGTESFLGYECEKWTIPGGTQLVYNGIMLKAEMTILGIKTVTTATSATFGSSVPDRYFELPSYPIEKQDNGLGEMDNGDKEVMKKVGKMSFEEWKKLAVQGDEELENSSDEELRKVYDMTQKFIKMNSNN